jgi:protein-tyrosine phosphatase
MAHLDLGFAAFAPSDEVMREIARIVAAQPALRDLLERQPDEPDVPVHRVLRPGSGAYYVVPVPIPGRSGSFLTSRVPGRHREHAAADVRALAEHGVHHVVCLVARGPLVDLHGGELYLSEARARFGERFHLVDVLDHQLPMRDADFERCVLAMDAALARGETVLAHCIAGCGRTGMFAACLMVLGGLEPLEAVRTFRRHRRCGPDTVEQIAYVIRFAERLRDGLVAR